MVSDNKLLYIATSKILVLNLLTVIRRLPQVLTRRYRSLGWLAREGVPISVDLEF